MTDDTIMTTNDPELLRLAVLDRDCSLAAIVSGTDSYAYARAVALWAEQSRFVAAERVAAR